MSSDKNNLNIIKEISSNEKFINNNSSNQKKEESIWFYLFSHHERHQVNRMIHFRIFNRNIYLCGRCTFRYLAILITLIMMFLTGYTTRILYEYPIILILNVIVFPILSSITWIHQYITKKDNPKIIRYTTGYLIGTSEAVGISCIIWWDLLLIIFYVIVYLSIMSVVGIILYKKGAFSQI